MNNNNQSHDLPNIGLSNQQLLSSLNANSAAGGGNATNISSANTNNSHPTTASTSTLPSCSTTNSIAINIPLSQLPSPTLCASCDKCRQRKTKCDGGRPCLNCITRYRKTKKLDASASLEGIDYSQFDCIYSPAKRRGPVPGKTSKGSSRVPSNYPMGITSASQYNALQQQQISSSQFGGGMNNNMGQIQQLTQAINNGTFTSDELKQMLVLQQQLLISQQNSMLAQQSNNSMGTVGGAQGVLLNNMLQQQQGMALGHNNGGLNGGVGMNNNGMNINNNMTNLQNTTSNQTTMPGLMDANGNIDMNVLQSLTDQQLGIQMQLQQQQQQQMPDNNNLMSMNNQQQQFMIPNNQMSMSPQLGMTMDQQNSGGMENNGPSAKRVHTNGDVISTPDPSTIDGLPPSVIKHLPLLQLNNSNGVLLRSYYELSTNDILHLPRIPTDSEYCNLLNQNNAIQTVYNIPTYDQSALYAARFSEIALGALANNQLSLGLELSNASVMCLRNCCFVDNENNQQGQHTSCAMYNVARAYLLHGIFRSFRGDMVRYFKYRRVCMTLIQQMDNEPQVDALLAAISFHDAWTYMMHNASEDALPEIDGAIPKLNNNNGSCPARTANEVMAKYGCDTHPSSVAADPDNQMWMQGPPPVFLNNEAHLISRSLDAFACAVRSCCDQANTSFEGMAKASGVDILGNGKGNVDNDASSTSAIPTTVAILTPTTTAVMANENELCSRNIVMSAKTLLDQHWAVAGDSGPKRHGLDMMVHALSAFLEKDPPDPSKQAEQLSSSSVDGNEEGGGGTAGGSSGGEEEGFSESQIQNLLAACDIIIQHPLLLHCPGPIYHMSSNAAIMLCHLLNGIHAKCDAASKKSKDDGTSPPPPAGDDDTEMMNGMSMLFDQVLDTFISMRKILNLHRQNLPPKLRCHGIPRPSGLGPFKKSSESSSKDTQQQPFIELGDTLMCLCRGCQGFVLMGCSPCVAAERTMKTALDHALDTNNGEVTDPLRVEGDNGPLEDMALDDDYLLDILSKFNS